MKMCEYKTLIAQSIMEHYDTPEEIDGCNLHELGEWIDICKDIAEMEYYEAKASKEQAIVEAMENTDETGERSMLSVIQSLTNMVEESIPTMEEREKMVIKSKVESLLNTLR